VHDKGVVVLQRYTDLLGVVPGSCSETCLTSDGDGNEVVNVEVEEDIDVAENVDIKEEDVTMDFSEVHMEREVTYMYVCQLLDIVAILIELPPALIVV
jgi:hypothetical protein